MPEEIPLALYTGPANVNDFKLAEMTLKSFVIDRPDPDIIKQHMCVDKGYDYPEIDVLMASYNYIEHIQRKGESVTSKIFQNLNLSIKIKIRARA